MGDDHLPYFTEFTLGKAALYAIAGIYVISVSIVSVWEPMVALPCDGMTSSLKFANPVYEGSPCRSMRFATLLWFTREECSYARRLVSAVLLGGIIGWERRQADRPAGIRTMSLVSLGSSLFTITSTFAFLTGPNSWDASRISAAIPSGVGFLGAGLIFKEQKNNDEIGPTHVVHGLTTAASLWLSAAVGIACGGELYFAASFGTAIMLLLLRFGPRNSDIEDDDNDDDEDEENETLGGIEDRYGSQRIRIAEDCGITERDSLVSQTSNSSLFAAKQKSLSQRNRARSSLATNV